MATIEQIKALIRAHFDSNEEKFKTVVLQIAAHEAKVGHTASAREIKEIIQNPKYLNKNKVVALNKGLDILEQKMTHVHLSDLIVSVEIEEKIKRVINEYHKKDLLRKNGLMNRSKLLLAGDPGTGKTMTASVIANELYLPLYVIQFDRLITKYMGETSAKLRQVFDQIKEVRGVYLFDEFDAIGSDRNLDNDVGEMRRILNSFLQNLEDDESYSIIIAATNNPSILDNALFRRFDDVMEYKNPDIEQITRLFKMKLHGKASNNIFTEDVYKEAKGLNHADIVKACEEAVKYSILEDQLITKNILLNYIKDRKNYYKYKEA
ncbi:AAA family ATPase [Anaerobacillus isosaccharinicus]|uniref:ATP-binding protein n=1 Tax=Anaerobacillus isosaccharinicus TaxID=1532552 RepID=A0A1S2MEN7_9BACI|nr:AAA family ATPase [Anaerobacillus isosaccharinicus]MBA5584697.1 ATP-binding protein [Anaerobacillus isosaccharinicus]QOY36932.1 ATP-binding protein [Anaerobacillus isosaccharinicus]